MKDYRVHPKKTYPAKLLLFGEHTVNLGSKALAMPLNYFSGEWLFGDGAEEENLADLQELLPDFADYISQLQKGKKKEERIIDHLEFKQEVSEGLFFFSDIPIGYGVGSSGALVAAVLDRFGLKHKDDFTLPELRTQLAEMEAFFHGKSSGTDPLVCFTNKALLLAQEKIEVVKLHMHGAFTMFLIDTKIQRQATPFIEYFMNQSKDSGFRKLIDDVLIPYTDWAIYSMVNKKWKDIESAFYEISNFQFRHLPGLIPEGFQELWEDGLNSNYFKIKLCGAGGGGFLLGFTEDFPRFEKSYPDLRIIPVNFLH